VLACPSAPNYVALEWDRAKASTACPTREALAIERNGSAHFPAGLKLRGDIRSSEAVRRPVNRRSWIKKRTARSRRSGYWQGATLDHAFTDGQARSEFQSVATRPFEELVDLLDTCLVPRGAIGGSPNPQARKPREATRPDLIPDYSPRPTRRLNSADRFRGMLSDCQRSPANASPALRSGDVQASAHLPVDRLHHRVRFAPNRHRARQILLGKRLQGPEHMTPTSSTLQERLAGSRGSTNSPSRSRSGFSPSSSENRPTGTAYCRPYASR